MKNFRSWLKEDATPASPVATTTSSSTSFIDVAKVPSKVGCGGDCGKDFFKNWYYKKRKTK